MANIFSVVFGLFGGLAIFIYGMNLMSEGLQKVAGERMKQVLGILTKNVFFGVLAGAITTMVLQSSSATTVMVIGFVSAGLMSLPQAISVIFGANIGTTMTAQLIAFKLSDYIWPILFFGFLLNFMSKNEKRKNIGLTIFAFGLLFVGIETMGSMMKPLANSPVFVEMLQKVSHVPILGLLTGALMTVVVQSSSATIAVLQNLASTAGPDGVHSLLGLYGAIPILLGDNIGTTITALLASIGQSRNAKRTAVAHSIFNVIGSLFFLALMVPYAHLVQFISPKGPEIQIISRQVANAHTMFNILNTIAWMPFVFVMVKIVMFIVPESKEEEKKETEIPTKVFLDDKLFNQPVFALHLCQQEVLHSCEVIKIALEDTKHSVVPFELSQVQAVEKRWKELRDLQREIQHYLSRLISVGNSTYEQTDAVTELLLVSSNLERMCIQIYRMLTEFQDLYEKNLDFSDEGERELRLLLDEVIEMAKNAFLTLRGGDDVSVMMVIRKKEKISDMEEVMKDNHVTRLNNGICKPMMTPYFNSILSDLMSIGTYCMDMCSSLSYGLDVGVEERKKKPLAK